jgi:hypothetical protein
VQYARSGRPVSVKRNPMDFFCCCILEKIMDQWVSGVVGFYLVYTKKKVRDAGGFPLAGRTNYPIGIAVIAQCGTAKRNQRTRIAQREEKRIPARHSVKRCLGIPPPDPGLLRCRRGACQSVLGKSQKTWEEDDHSPSFLGGCAPAGAGAPLKVSRYLAACTVHATGVWALDTKMDAAGIVCSAATWALAAQITSRQAASGIGDAQPYRFYSHLPFPTFRCPRQPLLFDRR